ncbi:MAG TPA: PVC-type heme-binding CxxCH protein [Planctomycetota bacterium]|nr:PVC-type heme-binding CxxCH protein [Planctomycetota bacterium]
MQRLSMVSAILSLALLSNPLSAGDGDSVLKLNARSRTPVPGKDKEFQSSEKVLNWDPKKTAITVCDMWDKHWCKSATGRVGEMAPRMNEVLVAARKMGVLIIHCPSDTMKFYEGTPQRKLAQDAPKVETKIPLKRWCYLDKEREFALPIDDSDGGCDCEPQCKNYIAWKQQHEALKIEAGDAITDSAEAFFLMQQRGIENLIVMGVHTNMCVLGRPFSIRQMVMQGKNVVLMRDMTDSLYNPRKAPFVSHFKGTALMIEHIEKYWCPTVSSVDLIGGKEFKFKDDVASADDGPKGLDRALSRLKAPQVNTDPLKPEEALKRFKLPPGLAIDLIASEPLIRQPLYMTFDARGRMWVTEYIQYPFPAGLKIIEYDDWIRAKFDKVPPAPPNHFPGADKVTILEDADGDGVFEKSKTFVEGLSIATSALPGYGGVWVTNPPYLLFYRDADGDDIPDGPPQVVLSGFGLEDTHAVANNLRWGPDGWLYGAHGSTSTAKVKNEWGDNKVTEFLGQAIWRYHPRERTFEVFAEGGGNTFGVEFDDNGFLYSGTNHGNVRGLHYVQGGYYLKSWGKHGPLTNPYAFGWFEHMPHTGYGDRLTHTFSVYGGGLLPEKYRGKIISPNSLQKRVQVTRLEPNGSTFKTIEEDPLVMTDDGWFRPVDLQVGPDGAVYIADFYEQRISHVDPRDTWDRKNGRIYRVRPADWKPAKTRDFTKLSNAELLDLIGSENRWERDMAMQVIREQSRAKDRQQLIEDLSDYLSKNSGRKAVQAFWTVASMFPHSIPYTFLDHPDPLIRFWAIRFIGDSSSVQTVAFSLFLKIARNEKNLHVRSQLASSAKRLPAEQALPILNVLMRTDENAQDPHLPLLIWWALESKTESAREAVLALFHDESLWRQPLVEEHILERLMQRYAMAGGGNNLLACSELLHKAPDVKQANKLLSGLEKAFAGRSVGDLPPELKEAFARAKTKGAKSSLALDLRFGVGDALERAMKIVADEKSSKAQRIDFIRTLADLNVKESAPTLLAVAEKTAESAVQAQALTALQRFDDPAIAARVVELLPKLPEKDGVRAAALTLLSGRPSAALAFLQAIDSGKLSARSIPLDMIRQMKLHTDERLTPLLEKHFGRVQAATAAEKLKEIERISALISAAPGKAAEGKAVFTATCAKCHALFGEGSAIGPDLTGYERTNAMYWIENIVDPNAAIREEYTNFVVKTKDGRILTGLIAEQDNKTVTLKSPDGPPTKVAREDIEKLKASPQSLMPEDQLSPLTEQQIRDLFAYLMKPAEKK